MGLRFKSIALKYWVKITKLIIITALNFKPFRRSEIIFLYNNCLKNIGSTITLEPVRIFVVKILVYQNKD
jgi:hypothetical protein